MSIFIAAILGLIQGLCEFLPISSSGHLMLAEFAFGIRESTGGAFFTVMLHLGTLIAVCAVYYKQIWDIIKHPIQKKTGMLLISTIATGIIYIAGKKLFDHAMDSGKFLGLCFLVTGGLLVAVDLIKRGKKKTENLKTTSALGIGLIQGVAILPGISRSGATIAGATIFGLDRESAAEYSFLLSIPAILAGAVMEVPDAISQGVNVDWLCVLVGVIVAAVSGYFAVKFMIKLITNKRMWGFAVYVFALGIFVLLDQLFFHIVF